jgi:hypothetical protein
MIGAGDDQQFVLILGTTIGVGDFSRASGGMNAVGGKPSPRAFTIDDLLVETPRVHIQELRIHAAANQVIRHISQVLEGQQNAGRENHKATMPKFFVGFDDCFRYSSKHLFATQISFGGWQYFVVRSIGK